MIDVILPGAWFEARIVKIMSGDEVAGGDGLAYHIAYEGYPDFGPVKVITLAICNFTSFSFVGQ